MDPVYGSIFLLCVVAVASLLIKLKKPRMIKPDVKKTIIITGCDSGLGYFCALECLGKGFSVISTVLSKSSEGSKSLMESKNCENLFLVEMNLVKEESIAGACEAILNYLNNNSFILHAVINNAGVMCVGEFEWFTNDIIKHQIAVNFTGPALFTKQLIPKVREHQSRIINVTSHCSLHALPGFSIYSATKAALKLYTDALHMELKKFNVKAIIFIPGSFVNKSNITFQTSKWTNEMREAMAKEQWNTYGEYFSRYYEYFSLIWDYRSPMNTQFDENIIGTFMKAVLEKNPKRVYKLEPLRYWLYYNLFKICPLPELKDYLTEKFVTLPPFKKPIE